MLDDSSPESYPYLWEQLCVGTLSTVSPHLFGLGVDGPYSAWPSLPAMFCFSYSHSHL